MREGKPFEKGFPLSRSPLPKLFDFGELYCFLCIVSAQSATFHIAEGITRFDDNVKCATVSVWLYAIKNFEKGAPGGEPFF